jgi:hypothetical protein
MNDDEDALAGIDLQAWQVPPPAPVDRSSLLGRALSPATEPARRPRLRWLVAGIVLANAALATLIVIVLARPSQTKPIVTVQPAGGSSVDARTAELLQRLAAEQLELQTKLAELQAQHDLIRELQAKVAHCEERDRTIEKEPEPTQTCDEVSCVLNNYEGTCCLKYRKDAVPDPSPGLPEALDREAISRGIASVKAGIAGCADGTKGIVKVHARVDPNGLVTSVDAAPDGPLGACVESIVQRAVFPRTRSGGSFSYPYVF